jgi:hypothetical protein
VDDPYLRLEQHLALLELNALQIWKKRLDVRWWKGSEQVVARLAHRAPVPSSSDALLSGRRPVDETRGYDDMT